MDKFRLLTEKDIDCRIGTKSDAKKGVSILLYRDARVDMDILDESVGSANWQREHYECKGNLFCRVGIKQGDVWVWKSDCGTESNTEKEKGEASDSFKRACVNWGIGRELYTAPFIWINLTDSEWNNGKPYIKFSVQSISYDKGRNISALVIVDSNGKTRYTLGKSTPAQKDKPLTDEERDLLGAVQEAKSAKSAESLLQVWKTYKSLQSEPRFIEAVKKNPNNPKRNGTATN